MLILSMTGLKDYNLFDPIILFQTNKVSENNNFLTT